MGDCSDDRVVCGVRIGLLVCEAIYLESFYMYVGIIEGGNSNVQLYTNCIQIKRLSYLSIYIVIKIH